MILQIFPTSLLSRLFGLFSKICFPSPIQIIILKLYASYFKLRLDEAEKGIHEYKSLQEFFTRKLKKGIRKTAKGRNICVSPVDGIISHYGKISESTALQIKKKTYTIKELLGDTRHSKHFIGGDYFIFYLSPRDCHRIYSPFDLKVLGYNYVPGRLMPVNEIAVLNVQKLFAKNERLVSFISDTKYGGRVCAMVKVGATNVGSISVSYDPNIATNGWSKKASAHNYEQQAKFGIGEEFACFEMGSTVILFFEKDTLKLAKKIKAPQYVQYGTLLGKMKLR